MNPRVALPAHLARLGLVRNPFPQTPDADCYFRTEHIEQQFTEALHCVSAGKGFVLLTGEVGSGKSTFLRCLLDQLVAADCAVAYLFNTFLQGPALLQAINRDFGLAPGGDLAADVALLNAFLIGQHQAGKTCVAVIDDAQNLDTASLELLRLLSNLETRQHKLLQIVLSGQPELLAVLARPEIRQLTSRIVQHIGLNALSRDEAARYIDFRLAGAGSGGGIGLTAAAQSAMHRHARGNPRRIHLIMDRCLYGVLATAERIIGPRLVNLAASEVGVGAAPWRVPRKAALAGAAGLAIALAAWAQPRWPAAAPAAAAPAPSPLAACLGHLGAAGWLSVLDDGLNGHTRGAVEQALAPSGLALAAAPHGVDLARLPAGQAANICQWRNRAGAWALWRPAFAPFGLKSGDRGAAVRWLQERLALAGRYHRPIDGVAGPHTLLALAEFQRDHGLAAAPGVDASALFLLEHGLADQRAA